MLFPSLHFVLVLVVLYLSTSPSAPNPPPPPRVESRGSRLGRGVSRRPTLSARSTQLCCCRCSSSSSTNTRLCRTDGAVQLHLADPHDSTTVHRPHSLTVASTAEGECLAPAAPPPVTASPAAQYQTQCTYLIRYSSKDEINRTTNY